MSWLPVSILLAAALALTGCAGAMLQGALANGYDRCESQPDPVRRIRCYEATVSKYSTAAPQTAVAFLRDARWIRAQLAAGEIGDAGALELLRELRRVATIVAGEEIRIRQASASARSAAAWQGAANSLLIWQGLQPSTTDCTAFGGTVRCTHR